MSQLIDDIRRQPALLRELASFYGDGAGAELLAAVRPARAPLLTGMGASFHAALIAATQLQAGGVCARAVEATELLFYGEALLRDAEQLVFVSQSGASAEVGPLTGRLGASAQLVAVTNVPESRLGRAAHTLLPVMAGPGEAFVATRTYSCSLAVLWLLAARLRGANPDAAQLVVAADAIAMLLADGERSVARWMAQLAEARTLVFLGHGPHAATARQAAMMLAEWARVPAIGTGSGAFRHGLIEVTEPGVGVVLFAAPGPAYASSCALAAELRDHGASVLIVEHGRARAVDERAPAPVVADEFLAPLLDIVSAQLFVDTLARARGAGTGFRHISKVVTQL